MASKDFADFKSQRKQIQCQFLVYVFAMIVKLCLQIFYMARVE